MEVLVKWVDHLSRRRSRRRLDFTSQLRQTTNTHKHTNTSRLVLSPLPRDVKERKKGREGKEERA